MNWDDYFLGQALNCSIRSKDKQTKVGAVIVDTKNRMVSTAYNSFSPGLLDSELPTTRPDKYPWMIHAERNAVEFSTIGDMTDCTIYITIPPCFDCAQMLYRHGIKSAITLDLPSKYRDDLDTPNYKLFRSMSGFKVFFIEETEYHRSIRKILKEFGVWEIQTKN